MEKHPLKRTIGLLAATSIGLGAMLGAGIFVFPGLAGGEAGYAAILSFFIGGLIALGVAACTAELATAMPQSGGGYFFISRSFGPFWGTLAGIAQWVGLVFACAFYLTSFGEYMVSLLRETNLSEAGNTTFLALIFTFLLLLVNVLGTKQVGRFQNGMVIALTVLLVVIFTYGLLDYFGFGDKSRSLSDFTPGSSSAIFTTTALIFTSYLGFVQIANIGAEIKQPSSNLPRSLLGSVVLATGLYMFIMFVCISVLPQSQLEQYGEMATIEVAREMLGHWGAIVVVFAGVLAALSSANASMISASRGVFALSKDKVISPQVSTINKRFGTPHIALIAVSIPTAAMLFRGRLEVFAEVASFLHLLLYAGICLAVLRLRSAQPNWYAPTFRVPAAKLVARLGAVSCLVLVFFMQKTSILLSLAIVVLAALYYALRIHGKQIALSKPEPPHLALEFLAPEVLIPVNLRHPQKDLPQSLIKALPISRILLVGYQETPEQTEEEQSAETFQAEAEAKLADIIEGIKDNELELDTEFIFSHDAVAQVQELLAETGLQFILTLRPLANLKRIIVPLYDPSQINTALRTLLYNFHGHQPIPISVLLFTQDGEAAPKEEQLRQAMNNQLQLVHIEVEQYETYSLEEYTPESIIKDVTTQTDVLIWSEASATERDVFHKLVLARDTADIPAPIIMICQPTTE